MNAVFGLKIQISIGENIMTAIATGTAFYVKSLPSPPALKVFRTLEVVDEEDQFLLETQRKLMKKSEMNRQRIEESLLQAQAESVPDVPDEFSDGNSSDEEDGDLNVPSRLQQKAMVIEIDDEQDEDLILFLDDSWSDEFQLCNIDLPTDASQAKYSHFQMVTMVKQHLIDPTHHPNRQLAMIFKSIYQELAFQMSFMSPCIVTGVSYSIQIPKINCVQVSMTAMVYGNMICESIEETAEESTEQVLEQVTPLYPELPRMASIPSQTLPLGAETSFIADPDDGSSFENDDELCESDILDEEEINDSSYNPRASAKPSHRETHFEPIELTPLSSVPNATNRRFLGRISLHFIKETNLVYESIAGVSGIGEFVHVFMMEMLAVVKAHVVCLGGNAVVGFNLDQVHFTESLKNQGYALVSVSGDVMEVSYDADRNLEQVSAHIFPKSPINREIEPIENK